MIHDLDVARARKAPPAPRDAPEAPLRVLWGAVIALALSALCFGVAGVALYAMLREP